VEIANIGDSRIYYYSYQNNSWKQLSWDHNLFNFLRAKYQKQRELHPGWITQINQEEQKALEANKNSLIALTKCVETGTKIKKDDSWYKVIQDVKTDDLFYICTDGVYHWIKNERINNIVKETQNFDDVAKKVVAEAIANKSNDNLTAIVIRINGNK
jgi:serine/threonine protein phosphatase PrpC